MKSLFKPLLVSVVLATVGLGAMAQGAGGSAPQPGGMPHHRHMDPAKMQEIMAKRQAELKAKLKLTAIQDGAWASYVAAMQPPADMGSRMNPENRKKMHDEMEKLTTPERIDRMNAMKAQRDADLAKRGAATKTFYAALSPEQQKVFDANAMRHGPGERHGGHGKPAQNG